MYLVICKNKHGLSVQNIKMTKCGAQEMCNHFNDELKQHGNTYHVRKFDLASIDLEKLMEADEEHNPLNYINAKIGETKKMIALCEEHGDLMGKCQYIEMLAKLEDEVKGAFKGTDNA